METMLFRIFGFDEISEEIMVEECSIITEGKIKVSSSIGFDQTKIKLEYIDSVFDQSKTLGPGTSLAP